jgi:hypothetical protein
LLAVATLVSAACDNPNAVPAHSATEQKAINDYNKLTPQQQIDLIEKGPMPAAAKAAMVQRIKTKNGLK